MLCPVCRKYMKTGTTNTHHYNFPKRKFRGTQKGKITMQIHIACHNEFNYFFSHTCKRELDCFSCKYQCVCCYYKDA